MPTKKRRRMTLQAIVEDACAQAVKEAGGNKSLAAERLNINRVTLRKYLRGSMERLKSNQRKKQRGAGSEDRKRDSR